MARTQLRIHGDTGSLGDEIAGAVLKVLPFPLKTGARGRALALAFRKAFGDELRKWVIASEHCGNLTWCSEELESLGEGDERLEAPGMRVYILSDPAAPQKMISGLSALAYRTIVRSGDRDEVRPIPYSRVTRAVETTLMRHAFDSKWCGEETICKENLAI
jgi:hypothetical protein